jgi:tetratricopeptide (TPR) repeat protein
MHKKLSALLMFLLMISFSFAAVLNAEVMIELRGGMAMISPTILNANLTNAFSYAYGADSSAGLAIMDNSSLVSGSTLSQMSLMSGNIQFFLNPSAALYLRTDFLYTESTDTVQVDGVDAFTSHIGLNVGYLGVGGRYYIGRKGGQGFFPYIGADLGMFFQYDSFWEIYGNTDAGSPALPYLNASNYYSDIDFKDSFFGGNIEAGAVYMFNDTVGIGAGLGYRIAGPVAVSPGAGTQAGVFATAPFSNFTKLDLSGIYLSAGLNFAFGGKATTAASSGSGAGAKYEQYGDYYQKQKNYAYALKYYAGAVKLDPKNAGLYKKIGLTYYYLKDMAHAKQYLAYYLKLNPDDAQIKKWLGM